MRFLLFFLFCLSANAATYYVRTDGADTNDGLADAADTGGTAAQAWLTIGKASSTMVAGDTVRVQSGTYNEAVAETTDGSAGNWITYLAEPGETVIVRRFDLTGTDYIRIIGFEITHIASTYSRAITMGGTGSHIEILDNYIHNTYGDQCIQSNGTYSYVTIRGNYINEVRWVSGVEINCERQAIGCSNTASFWLVEYNHIRRSGDFINLYGTDHIQRNNYLHDYSDSYCVVHGAGAHTHSDMFQPGSDGLIANNRRCVYERNFMGDSPEVHSHVFLFQDGNSGGGGGTTDYDHIVRGNVAFNIGDGFSGGFGTDELKHYNNTAYMLGQGTNGSAFYYNAVGDLSTLVYNNIISEDGLITSGNAILLAGTGSLAGFNLGYNAGTEASYVSTSDPLFVNPVDGVRNFRLQAGSPAINTGKADIITIASANGSGTSFDVNNGKLLCDGKGICEGDVVTIGATTTRVTAISGNTITVAASVSWTMGDNVYWGTDADPDIGAIPYGSTALTAAHYAVAGTTYTVTPIGNTRMVIFYQNGSPHTVDYDAPYTATIASGTVTMKAYALYAQETAVFSATAWEANTITTSILNVAP